MTKRLIQALFQFDVSTGRLDKAMCMIQVGAGIGFARLSLI